MPGDLRRPRDERLHALPRLADAQRAGASNGCTPTARGRSRPCPRCWAASRRSSTPFVLMPQSLGESRQLPAMLRGQGVRDGLLLRFGARLDGLRRLCPFGRRRAAREPRGLRSPARHRRISTATGASGTNRSCNSWARSSRRRPNPSSPRCSPSRRTIRSSYPSEYAATLPDGYTRIHKGVAYDDQAFRLFFDRFGGEEWFRRTIFVFVADHVSSEKFARRDALLPGQHAHHRLHLHPRRRPAGRGAARSAQQLDIMPTVLGLAGNDGTLLRLRTRRAERACSGPAGRCRTTGSSAR